MIRHIVWWIGAALSLTQVGWAQNPSDIAFTLATKAGKTSFRMGEAMAVEFRFASTMPGLYLVYTDAYHRVTGSAKSDQFTADPGENAVDPLLDLGAQLEAFIGRMPTPEPVTSSPLVVERLVNEWISFRKPGRYRISAQTTRLRLSDHPSDPVPLRSNAIEIEVVAPEPGWAAVRVQEAVASLDRGWLPPSADHRIFDLNRLQEMVESARVLRLLETREAALAMVRFFGPGSQLMQSELRPGLFGSPYRNEVISALEEQLMAPDVPVTMDFMCAISELATAQAFGPRPIPDRYPEASHAWVEHYLPNWNRYMGMLSAAVGRKQGQSRAVSLDTLLPRGSQPASAAATAALIENFSDLPANTQQRYLTTDWYLIASPTIEPLVRSLAEGTGPMRNAALGRLQELNPEAARKITIDRIRRADITREDSRSRALLLLPDPTLPEVDEPLVNALEQGKPVDWLVARYTSNAMLSRIRDWTEAHPDSVCDGPLLAYLFRFDLVYAADRLARARLSRPECHPILSGQEDLLISPGLEQAAFTDLANPSTEIQRCAQTLLQYGGSSAAEQALWDALQRLRASKKEPQDLGLESGLVDALSRGIGWILTPEKRDRLAAA